jgi:hypothetical protein
MLRWSLTSLFFASLLFLAAPLHSGCPDPPREKTVWNYDGGLQMVTDGTVPNGPCFRLTGRLTAADFFTNLRRVDSTSGTFYKRGNDIVTGFPDVMHLSFVIYDHPCSFNIEEAGAHAYLTKALISTFRIGFSWKHGMEMRPAQQVSLRKAEAHSIPPYAEGVATRRPERYEGWFEFDVPCKDVPLTDSFVMVLYSVDNRVIARVAGRM